MLISSERVTAEMLISHKDSKMWLGSVRVGYAVLCKSDLSEMCEFRSLFP